MNSARLLALATLLAVATACSRGSPHSTVMMSPVAVADAKGLTFYRMRIAGRVRMLQSHGGSRLDVASREVTIYRYAFGESRARRVAVVDGQALMPRGSHRSEQLLVLDAAPWVRWHGDAPEGCFGMQLDTGARADLCPRATPPRLSIHPGSDAAARVDLRLTPWKRELALSGQTRQVDFFHFSYLPAERRVVYFNADPDTARYRVASVAPDSAATFLSSFPPASDGREMLLVAARPGAKGVIHHLVAYLRDEVAFDRGEPNRRFAVFEQRGESMQLVASFDDGGLFGTVMPFAFIPERDEAYFLGRDANGADDANTHLVGIRYRTGERFVVALE